MAVDEVECCAVVTYVSNPLSSCARSAANDAANDGQNFRSVFLVNREPFHRFHCHISILVVNPHLVEVIIVCRIFNPVHKRVHGNAGAHVLVCGLVTSALRTYDLTIV